MKITCNRERFLHAFQSVSPVAPVRSPKPILQNVKLEVGDQSSGNGSAGNGGARLLATDLEIGIRHAVEGVEVSEPGAVVLPSARFGQILREMGDETFKLETDGQKTLVQGERSRFNLPAENPGEFPGVGSFDESVFYEAPARLLKEIIRRTIFATDNESSRYALGGVKLEWADGTLVGVGTDGRRLAKMEGPVGVTGGAAPFGDATIVPSRSLQLIDRALSDDETQVQIAVRQNEILVRNPQATITSRLLEGRFPKWREVFPQRSGSAKIDLPVGPFAGAVRQAAIVTSDESRGIDFTFGGGSLVLSGHAAEVGESRVELPIGYDGDEITIKLDPRFLVDFLKVLDAEQTFTFDLESGESAAVATTGGYGYVIMPLARDR